MAAERSVLVRLRANVADFKREMDSAAKSVKAVGDQTQKTQQQSSTTLGRLANSAQTNREAWDQVGKTLVGFGAATVGALGLATKAAIDWESAWAGVTKTVDGTDAQMAVLEEGLRNLAKTLPATHTEIAAVAEAAGQLGVQRGGIVSFVRTMVDLSETTNLSADEAATSIAQMANIMGIKLDGSTDDVARLGATLVALGNDGASTERDIIKMGQRIAGAGRTVGMSAGEVLGWANALASVGIEVEAGGTAFSRVALTIDKAVADGGDDLTQFARVAGMSAGDFAEAFRTRPSEAIQAFIEGLARIQREGGNTTGVLDDLGLGEIRVSDALRRLSANTDVSRKSLELQSQAWVDNTALVEEARKRYETTEAQLQMTKNAATDAAIEFGEVLLPAVQAGAEGVRDFANWLGSLDEGQRRAIVGIGGITGATALMGGAFLLVFPRVIETVKAFRQLRDISPGTASGLGKVGKAAGVATIAVAGLNLAAAGAWDAVARAVPSASEAARALTETETGVDSLNASLLEFKESNNNYGFTDLEEGLRSLADPGLMNRLSDLTGEITSLGSSEGRTERTHLIESLRSMGEGLATLAETGHAELAAEQFRVFEAAAKAAGMSTEELLELIPAYRDYLAQADTQQKLTAGSAEKLQTGFGGVQMTAEEAEDAIKGLNDALDRLLNQSFSVEEAQDAVAQAAISLTETVQANKKAVEENGVAQQGAATKLDGNSKSALANREALRTLVERHADVIRALAETGASSEELQAKAEELKGEFYKQVDAAGIARSEVKHYADVLDGVPGQVATSIYANVDQALEGIRLVRTSLDKIGDRTVRINTIYSTSGRRTSSNPFVQEGLADGGLLERVGAGLVQRFSDGGFAGLPPIGAQQPQIQTNHGPMGIMWAETGAGPWESFISGHPAKRDRSINMWEETGHRLGLNFVRFDQGGFFQASTGRSMSTAKAGTVTAVLAPEDRALLRAVADRPVSLQVDGREVASTVNDYNASRRS